MSALHVIVKKTHNDDWETSGARKGEVAVSEALMESVRLTDF